MDAIEETLRDGDFHEVIVSTLPHHISQWLHTDLPSRTARPGISRPPRRTPTGFI
jgi:hypothetical protein